MEEGTAPKPPKPDTPKAQGEGAGEERAAILYTMPQECERCKVDAHAWLTRVLEILPAYRGNYADLMPGKVELPATASNQL